MIHYWILKREAGNKIMHLFVLQFKELITFELEIFHIYSEIIITRLNNINELYLYFYRYEIYIFYNKLFKVYLNKYSFRVLNDSIC